MFSPGARAEEKKVWSLFLLCFMNIRSQASNRKSGNPDHKGREVLKFCIEMDAWNARSVAGFRHYGLSSGYRSILITDHTCFVNVSVPIMEFWPPKLTE